MSISTMKISFRDLPLHIELEGENGEYELYTISPAGRKFGAFLVKADAALRKLLRRR